MTKDVRIEVLPGVESSVDSTPFSTRHYIDADKIRFRTGYPEKIRGFESLSFDNANVIGGCGRTLYPFNTADGFRHIIGTDTRLYFLANCSLTNITPLEIFLAAIPNSLNTYHKTLANNPIATVIGSNVLTITDTSTKVRTADTITLSGSTSVNGIPAAEINAAHFVRGQGTNEYTVTVASNATSTGSGGGASVVQATGIITVNAALHGMNSGDRSALDSAADTGGILAAEINIEHIIRNVTANDFDVLTTGTSTSSVSGGGSPATTFQSQITEGQCNASATMGYGVGLYGVGLYGVAKEGTAITGATSWTVDRFGNNIVSTRGNQTGLYIWDLNTSIAPVLVANAPTAINYVFVRDNIVVTFGASGVQNRLKWSDQGDIITWTAEVTNKAGEDDIEGAGEFLSHASLKTSVLLFTESEVYTFRFVDRPLIWETKILDISTGIISKNARVVHRGVCYWMGNDDFYFYRSGDVENIPSNSKDECTIKRKVFDDINLNQKSKIFAWYNFKFDEIWFHYPSSSSEEPDKVARLNINDFSWANDTFDRSAASYPVELQEFPFMLQVITASSTTTMFRHEIGTDADGAALPWSLTTNFTKILPKFNIQGLIPDSLQVGNISVTVNTKRYPNEVVYNTQIFTVSPTTNVIDFRQYGRYIQFVLSGSEVGQSWRGGDWYQKLIAADGK